MTSAVYSRQFLIVLLAAVVVAGSTFALGQWQLRRAALKQALQMRIQTQNLLEVLNTPGFLKLSDLAAANDRVVSLSGRWVESRTVYLDNRPMGDKTGFWVYTPLLLANSDQAVLVQRGWVPRNFMDRSKLPPVETPLGAVTISGRIAPPPSKLYAFEGADQGQIRQNIDVVSFGQEIGMHLLKMSVVQLGTASEGLRRDWPAPNLGVDKHYGYALQWFALSGLTVSLFVWFQLWVPWRSRRTVTSPVAEDAASIQSPPVVQPDRH